MKNNKILILTILTIVFTIIGSTFAFWSWNTSEAQKTLIGFTVEPNLSCTGDGGGNITSSEKKIVPTSCTNQTYAIQRTITLNTSSTISTNDLFLDLWLDVIDISEGLTNSENFKYAITKNPNDCTTNAITGSFNGKTNGGRVNLLRSKEYIGTNQDTYYLYIWLDEAEENTDTMNQSFELKLGGSCQDDKPNIIEDDGYIYWNGNTEGLTAYRVGAGLYVYKVSDKIIYPIEFNGAHIVGYGVGEYDLVDEDIVKEGSVWFILYDNVPAIVVSNDESFFGKGTYFLKVNDEMYMSELTYTPAEIITFTCISADGKEITLQALEGMTWPEWVESAYNDGSFKKTEGPSFDGEPGSYIDWTYDNNVFGGRIGVRDSEVIKQGDVIQFEYPPA